MPPETPSRMRATAPPYRRSLAVVPAATSAGLAAVAVADLARRDLVERDLQVVLRGRLDHGRDVLLECALAEALVVRVDLARPLGGDKDGGVVRVDAAVHEQLVEAGLDQGWAPFAGRSQTLATRSVSSSTASSSRSLTTTCRNSSRAASSRRATASRSSICSRESAPRPTRRERSASSDGGAMNTCTASGSARRTCLAPSSSISSTSPASSPSPGAGRAAARSTSERRVPYRWPA